MRIDIATEPHGSVSLTVTSKGYNPDTLDDILNRALKVVQALQPKAEAPAKRDG